MIRSVAKALCGIFAVLAVASASAANAAPRALIYVAMVTPADPRAQTALVDWGQAFQFGLDPLINELSASQPSAVAPHVLVVPAPHDLTVAELEALSTEGQGLEVSSAISQWNESFSVITLTVYLGPLKGSLTQPVLTLQQKVLAGQYRVDRDALTLVALYAWGVETLALAPTAGRPAACSYFARARLIGRQIVGSVPDVAPVAQAAQLALDQNRCPHV